MDMKMFRSLFRSLLPNSLRPYRVLSGPLRGVRIYTNLSTDTQVIRGLYERAVLAWIVKNVNAGDVCYDIGAAEGYVSTCLAIACGKTGSVFSFEPSERGSLIGTLNELNKSTEMAEIIHVNAFVSTAESHISIDSFASQHVHSLSMLKIDVDGGEVEVLLSGLSTIRSHRPKLIVEVHSAELATSCTNLLMELGYSVERVSPPAYEHRPLAVNDWLFCLPIQGG